jgi:hypothetical protein
MEMELPKSEVRRGVGVAVPSEGCPALSWAPAPPGRQDCGERLDRRLQVRVGSSVILFQLTAIGNSSITYHTFLPPQLHSTALMFSRLSQVARHLSRPLPNLAHSSAAVSRKPGMASGMSASARGSSKIHTAACLIIGDEVLGGKAGLGFERM